MNKWIKTETEYPSNNQSVIARFWCRKNKRIYELHAIFKDYEECRGWKIKIPEDTELVRLPEEWLPLEKTPMDPMTPSEWESLKKLIEEAEIKNE